MINRVCAVCPVRSGYCEYDPLTDTIYPSDQKQCLILKREKNVMKEKTSEIIDYLKKVEEEIGNGYDECLQGAKEICSQETQHRISGMLTAARGIILMLQAVGTAIVCAVDNSKRNEHAEQEKNE